MFDYRFNGLPNMLTAQMPFMPQNMLSPMAQQQPQQIDPTATAAIPQQQQPMQVPQGDMNYFPPQPDANAAPITPQDYQASLSLLQPQQTAPQPAPAPQPQQSGGGMEKIAAFLQGLGSGNGVLSAIGGGMGAVNDLNKQNQTVGYLTSRGIPEGEAQLLAQSPQATFQVLQNMRKGGDPKAMLELQKLGLEVDNLRNPQIKPTSDIQEYNFAKGQGYQGSFAEYQQSMKKAGASSTNVSVGEGDKFYEALDKKNADTFSALSDTGIQARSKMAQIERLGGLMQASPTGATAALKLAAGEYGLKTEGLDDLQAAQALINELVPQQRQPGSGPMSDADLALFKQSLPRIINTPDGNNFILDTMRGITQYQIEMGNIADQVANREITASEGRNLIKNLKNPLEGFRSSTKDSAATGAPASTGVQVGKIEDGYRFKGGDPSNPQNWEKVN